MYMNDSRSATQMSSFYQNGTSNSLELADEDALQQVKRDLPAVRGEVDEVLRPALATVVRYSPDPRPGYVWTF